MNKKLSIKFWLLLVFLTCFKSFAVLEIKAVSFEEFKAAFNEWDPHLARIPKNVRESEDFKGFNKIFDMLEFLDDDPNQSYFIAKNTETKLIEGLLVTISDLEGGFTYPKYLTIDKLIIAPWNLVSYVGAPHDPIRRVIGPTLMDHAIKIAQGNKEYKGIKLTPLNFPKVITFYNDFFSRKVAEGKGEFIVDKYLYLFKFSK